jgi:hypothetical protein
MTPDGGTIYKSINSRRYRAKAMLRTVVVAAVASAALGVIGSAASSGPTVAQIKAAVARHSNNFVLANSYRDGRHAPGHGWLDLKNGGGRWVSANGQRVTLESVALDPRDPALADVTETDINYTTRTWSRTKRQEPARIAHSQIIDPLGQPGVKYRLLGVEGVDGRQTYHLRSTYFPHGVNETARLDVWFSTDQEYLIRFTRTTSGGKIIQRVDNHWLPRTPANLALLTTAIPSSFKQVSVSP